MPITVERNGQKITLQDEERQECEVWSRIMGYFRPVQDWNPGKQSEFAERVYPDEKMVFQEKAIE